MPFSTLHRSAQDQALQSIVSRPSTAFSRHSLYNNCPTCTEPGSATEIPSTREILPECTSCLSEPDIAECYRFPAAEERQHVRGCVNSDCAEAICNGCSDHEGYCDDCFVDYVSDCGSSFGCDDLDFRLMVFTLLKALIPSSLVNKQRKHLVLVAVFLSWPKKTQ